MQLNEVIRGQLQRVGGQQQMLIRCQKANHPTIQPATTILWPYVRMGMGMAMGLRWHWHWFALYGWDCYFW